MSKTATPRGVVDGQAPPSQEQAAPATPTDWEAIERAFRAGLLSLREIAKQHGVSEGAIRKKAKGNPKRAIAPWQRDLTAKVQEAVRTALVRDAVRTANARTTEREIIDEAAVGPVAAVKLHRRDVRRAQAIGEILMEQLEGAIGNREAIESEIFAETAEADNPKAEARDRQSAMARRNAMLKAVALPTHVAALRDLGTALSKFIPLERQAYSITSSLDEPAAVDEAVNVTDASLDAFVARLDKVLGKQAA